MTKFRFSSDMTNTSILPKKNIVAGGGVFVIVYGHECFYGDHQLGVGRQTGESDRTSSHCRLSHAIAIDADPNTIRVHELRPLDIELQF